MRHSLTFFLFFTFFGTLIANVSEDVYVTGSVIKKTSLLVANPISTFDLNNDKKFFLLIAMLKLFFNVISQR